MKLSLRTYINCYGFCFWLLSSSVTAQVIFKVPSPIKRHEGDFTQRLERTGDTRSLSISTDSIEVESTAQTQFDLRIRSDSSSNLTVGALNDTGLRTSGKPSQFLVTYMGAPLQRDTMAGMRYRIESFRSEIIEINKRKATATQELATRHSFEQDSLLVAILEDSIHHIREELIPLRQMSRSSVKAAFDLYRTIPSILPVRLRSLVDFHISSSYGMRVHPIVGHLQNHAGIDLPQPRYTAVYATADGIVDRIIWQPNGMGLAVYIVHPSGYQTGYGHLEDHSVLVGESVRRGQVIGRVGSTGLSTGPHLHYSVLAGTLPVDPASYCFLLLNALTQKKPLTSQRTTPKNLLHR